MKKKIISILILIFFAVFTMDAFAQSYVFEKNNDKIKVQLVVSVNAFAFNLKDVKITEGIFLKAMMLDAAYLLALQPDRFLNRFRLNAGSKPKDSIYGGWESLRCKRPFTWTLFISVCNDVFILR